LFSGDPHPGNILVRKSKRSRDGVEIVLLDHGLYRTLGAEFRLNYAHLWKAIYLGDEAEIAEYSKKMNVGNMYHMLASILTLRPYVLFLSFVSCSNFFQMGQDYGS
jgi:aarF domain-containing kinase